jgi:4-hydroxythreonine-4-phosphate dehydrogenase
VDEMSEKPIIAITMGDPSGIGPEIIAKALSEGRIYDICRPIVIGDVKVMAAATKLDSRNPQVNSVETITQASFRQGIIDVLDLKNIDITSLQHGRVDRNSGRAAVEYVKEAIDLALKGVVDAIATAPLNKEAMNLAGFPYPGHTEILAETTGSKNYAMMLLAGPLRVVHVTTHTSLRKACDQIKKERVATTIRLTDRAVKDLGIAKPRIAVAGLNPHAGEGGLFGTEEMEEIAPAIRECRSEGILAEGPFPPDTVFLRGKRGEFDAVVAMYHDQGHIPVKILGFEEGVNVTIGLPIIRTSVDHGTAFDIAWRGVADPRSMIEAIRVAADMAKARITAKDRPIM